MDQQTINNTSLIWQPLEEILRRFYSEFGLMARFPSEGRYLKSAFECTEHLWLQQFKRMKEVKIVMLSEAPLYGLNRKYIYDIYSPLSAFFHFKDLYAFIGKDSDKMNFKSLESKKSFFLDCLADRGFLILDIFPFALNKETAICFNMMSSSIYCRLLVESSQFYLVPKLKLIKNKAQSPPCFVFRYKRLFQKTNQYVESQLLGLSLINPGFKLESINGSNMSLNRGRLASIYTELVSQDLLALKT